MANSPTLKPPSSLSSNLAYMYRGVYAADNSQPLPTCWSPKDKSRCLKLSQSGLTVTYSSDASESRHNAGSDEPGAVRSDNSIPLSSGIYYFETSILHCDPDCVVSVGISTKRFGLSKLPGLDSNSFGYHSDGSIYNGSQSNSIKFGPTFSESDTIGCGVDLIKKSLFFTRNGIFLGKAFEGKIQVSTGVKLYPAIGLQGQGCRTTANFGDQNFRYAFRRHILEERESHESQLLASVSKDFMGAKMRELVAGYLVHHGYISSARAFSRWATLAGDTTSAALGSDDSTTIATVKVSNRNGYADGLTMVTASERETENGDGGAVGSCEQLPGLTSMLHRRRLRTLCRRCQYGRAAAALTKLYPQVVERYPELLVQLRCRQLVEMMHRHSAPQRPADSKSCSHESVLCGFNSVKSGPSTPSCVGQNHVAPMDVDSYPQSDGANFTVKPDHPSPKSSSVPLDVNGGASNHGLLQNGCKNLEPSRSEAHDFGDFTDKGFEVEEDEEGDQDGAFLDGGGGGVFDDAGDFDDDGFGQALSSPQGNASAPMDVDAQPLSHKPATATPTKSTNTEMQCLLRQLQFGRSLMNLVKEVRRKTGGLSAETESLLRQSVSLLAYSSPSSPDCPLRGLLDPSLRDTIAGLINSAILKEAHNLPAQPAVEQGLHALQQCFANRQLLEAQTLGRFLLYHLSPSDYSATFCRDSKIADPTPLSPSFTPADVPSDAVTVNGTGPMTPSLSNGCTPSSTSGRRSKRTGNRRHLPNGAHRRRRRFGAELQEEEAQEEEEERMPPETDDEEHYEEEEGEHVEEAVVDRHAVREEEASGEHEVIDEDDDEEAVEEEEDCADGHDGEEHQQQHPQADEEDEEEEEEEQDDDDEEEEEEEEEDEEEEDDDDDDDGDDDDDDEMDGFGDKGEGRNPYRRGPSGGSAGGSGSSSTGNRGCARGRGGGGGGRTRSSTGPRVNSSNAAGHSSSSSTTTNILDSLPALSGHISPTALDTLQQALRLRRSRFLGYQQFPTALSASPPRGAALRSEETRQLLLDAMLTVLPPHQTTLLASMDETTLKAYLRSLISVHRRQQAQHQALLSQQQQPHQRH
uniref:Ran-binding protein 10 n=1 Tax=Schistocephalus solidus TaxID=70667 RepID=A0A0X3P5V6_SCHSO